MQELGGEGTMSEEPVWNTHFIKEWKGPKRGDVPRLKTYSKIAETLQTKFAEKKGSLGRARPKRNK